MRIEFKGYFFIVTADKAVEYLGRVVSLGNNAMAITIFPFIFVRKSNRIHADLIRHETIHIRQQLELLFIGALFLYLYEYLYARFVKKLDARNTYYYSAMEQEAHRNAMNEHYLSVRKPYAVLRYITDKKHLK